MANMNSKPLILVTNDDGISAPGLRSLIHMMNSIGDVVVVAPDSPQSGMGHAITINSTLRCTKVKLDDGPQQEYSCSGTPADCVKLGVHEILKRKPDLCVSGINHGSNAAINVIYSGTMSAAIEAGIEGIPAIGFSLLDYAWNADFAPLSPFVEKITKICLKSQKFQKARYLMLTFPNEKKGKSKALKFVDKRNAYWIEEFDKRQDPMGKEYYWMTGEFINNDKGEDTDIWALENGYVSVVPTHFDLTAHHQIQKLNSWTF